MVARCGLVWDKARPWAKKAVLADSGLVGEVVARVGRVRSEAFLNILLTLLTVEYESIHA